MTQPLRNRDPGDEQQTIDQLHPCPNCKGKGHIEQPRTRHPDSWIAQSKCRVCFGTGLVNHNPDDHTIFPY